MRRFKEDPVGVQRRVLRDLLLRAAATEWGRRHAFAAIARSPAPEEEFRRRVPLATPEAVEEAVSRMRAGQPDVLWPGRVRRFARTAGTTGAPRLLPATDETLAQWARFSASIVMGHVVRRGNARCLRGGRVSLPGDIDEDPAHPGTWVGDISALAADYFRSRHPVGRLLSSRQRRARPTDGTTNLDDRLDAACDAAMAGDIRVLGQAPSWALLLFDRLIERHNRATGARAATVGEIWPNFELLIAGAVPLSTYRDALERRIGLPGASLLETYGSSETLVAFEEAPAADGMLLDLDIGTYFEFVQVSKLTDADPPRLGVADVRQGEAYVPIVSTCSGLWALPLGDVVRFTHVHPHRLVVEGRVADMIDSYGEKVSGEQAMRAFDAANAATGGDAIAFHVAPRPATPEARHAHRWFVEFTAAPRDVGLFARVLDERLVSASPAYAACREQKGLGAPEVVPLAPGVLHRALETVRGRLGPQAKVPRTSDRTEIADAVLAIVRSPRLPGN